MRTKSHKSAGKRNPIECRELALALIEECGEYARMTALFLAGEMREDGDVEGEGLWMRVADAVVALQGRQPVSRYH